MTGRLKTVSLVLGIIAAALTITGSIGYGIWSLTSTFVNLQNHLVNIDNSIQNVSKKGDDRDGDIKAVQSTLTNHWTVISETSQIVKRVESSLGDTSSQLSQLELKLTGSVSQRNHDGHR